MAKKQSSINVGKGFKRIFYVVAILWGLFLILQVMAYMSECLEPEKYVVPPYCDDTSDTKEFFRALIIWVATTFPAYYFLRWIGAGFKK
ncbi:hypothetical protein N8Z35_02140 [Pelagibacteraceae bacterium]|jgi:hypothetical protein|nr:hypothetical protein [Pelagibacteraceae bacterium]|tara:strand:- start:299 stop:565 length:267 start_codon:yes stop_codon:yes gene_type:complete